MAHRIGQQLGSYRLTRLLGLGGFAEVYLGEHILVSGKQAAIKVLKEEYTDAELHSFCKEAGTIFTLIHPLIVRVLDFGVEGRTPFLVMDYAPHGTLRQRHLEGAQVPLSAILRYTHQIAEALQYAHTAGIIHRDIKPENLLVGEQDQILLSDFGIAIKAHRPISQTPQKISGTALYMAPEQCEGRACQASDQYALAVVVYEWLSGEPPFPGNDPISIALRHIQQPPPPLRPRLPTLAPAVEQVVMQALAKNPNERFPSVQAFAAALEAASKTTDSRSLAGTRVPSSPLLSTGLPLHSSAQESSPASHTPALSSPPDAQLFSLHPPLPPATLHASEQSPNGVSTRSSPSSPLQQPAKRRREQAALEKSALRYAVGGLIIALIGVWFIAESGWQSAMVSWVVGGMAIIIGCVIFIVAFLL